MGFVWCWDGYLELLGPFGSGFLRLLEEAVATGDSWCGGLGIG